MFGQMPRWLAVTVWAARGIIQPLNHLSVTHRENYNRRLRIGAIWAWMGAAVFVISLFLCITICQHDTQRWICSGAGFIFLLGGGFVYACYARCPSCRRFLHFAFVSTNPFASNTPRTLPRGFDTCIYCGFNFNTPLNLDTPAQPAEKKT